MQEGWRRILTVEFSVRLVRTGKSLLMVQVSVSEPCRGRRERESGSDRAERTVVRSGDVLTFSQNIPRSHHMFMTRISYWAVWRGARGGKFQRLSQHKIKRFNLKKVARYPWFAESILQHLLQSCKQGPPLFKT